MSSISVIFLDTAICAQTDRYARADTKMKRVALDKAEIMMPQKPLDEFLATNIEDDMTVWLRNIGTQS